jgi:putative hydrolase of the HAD superfamily
MDSAIPNTLYPIPNTPHASPYKYLILDLDETLYPRNTGLMQEIARRITLYLTDRAGFSPEEAERLRKYFFARYGTTLRGLQVEYHVDTQDYLHFVHDIPLENYISPNPALDAMLGRIPLPKIILTSADDKHAQRVLARLGITHHFPIVFDIQAVEFYSKPDPRAYELVLRALHAQGPECIMVEDSARNLRPAKELFGMTTVLVDGQIEESVDVAIGTLLELEAVVKSLMAK